MIVAFQNMLIKPLGRWLLCLAVCCLPVLAGAQDDRVTDSVIVAPVTDTTITYTGDEENDDTEEVVATPVSPELRAVPDSAVNRFKLEKDFLYANDSAYWVKDKAVSERRKKSFMDKFYDFFSGETVRNITYIILGVLLVLLIYRIVVVNNLFMTKSSTKRTVNSGEHPSEIDDGNLDDRIQTAINERNYRAAVRFMFLKSLRGLNEKGWIRYNAQATNHEYISQVTPYGVGKEFGFLTYLYEYVWYGEFVLTEDQFNKVQQNFQQFYKNARL